MVTLEEAKKFLRSNFEEGAKCPCCGQFVKLYKRKITSSMAYGLIVINRLKEPGEIFHLNKFFKELPNVPAAIHGDMPKLRLWGLLSDIEKELDDGNPNCGLYTLTPEGRAFVMGAISVPKYCFMYNNKVTAKSEELTTIREALGDQFNYSELMEASYV